MMYFLELFGIGFAVWSIIYFTICWLIDNEKNIVHTLVLAGWCTLIGWISLIIKDWII